MHFASRTPGDTANDGTPRTAVGRVAPGEVAALARRARSGDLWALPAAPADDPRLCPTRIPDAPTATVTVFWARGATRVDDYLGCLDPSLRAGTPAMERFRTLIEEIDRVAGGALQVRGPGRGS